MSTDQDDPNAYNKNINRRMQQELDEANEPRNRAQAQLDRWVESERDLAAEEADVYFVGGYLERWSQTPSYTKGRRDRDWRIR
jgi:hypothetical protein